jgi:hypothetical protein
VHVTPGRWSPDCYPGVSVTTEGFPMIHVIEVVAAVAVIAALIDRKRLKSLAAAAEADTLALKKSAIAEAEKVAAKV